MARTITARMRRLKRDYPPPSAEHRGRGAARYCLGGALCLTQGKRVPWPDLWTLARALRAENRHLSGEAAWTFAAQIVLHNGASQWDAAWDGIEAALRWRPVKEILKHRKVQP